MSTSAAPDQVPRLDQGVSGEVYGAVDPYAAEFEGQGHGRVEHHTGAEASPRPPDVTRLVNVIGSQDMSSVPDREKMAFPTDELSVSFCFYTYSNAFGPTGMVGVVVVLVDADHCFGGVDQIGLQLPGLI